MNCTSISNNSTFTHEEGLRALLADKDTIPYIPPTDDSRLKVEGDKAGKVSSMYGKGSVQRIRKTKKRGA